MPDSPVETDRLTAATAWNFADVFEVLAAVLPDAPATIHGDRRRTWAEFDRRAAGVAGALVGDGLGRQEAVAQYLYNGPEYLETLYACFKAALVPVNTNYRYGADELAYVWSNAHVGAVVFHGTFTPQVAAVRPRVPHVRTWLWVDDGGDPCPSWARPYEDAGAAGEPFRPRWPRSPDDLFLLYTGGTTGLPKGVMWRNDDLFAVLNSRAERAYGDGGLDAVATLNTEPGRVHLTACPLMHGTGVTTSLAALAEGGSVVTLPGRSFDPIELLDALERQRVDTAAIVGDVFCRPLVDALDREPDRWDLSRLTHLLSSGVMWSGPVKQRLLARLRHLSLVDMFGSSEAIGLGRSVTRAGHDQTGGRFRTGAGVRVLDADDRDVEPGSGAVGRVALAGRCPIGYFADPDRSATTFPVIDGVRCAVPGDYATVDADGSLVLIGRGSACINTGGEKVFPEEVEETLKTHPAVADAAVVGAPDDRFGEHVVAIVELRPEAMATDRALVDHVKRHLAGYKAPKRVLFGPIGRSPSGKLDQVALRARAAAG